MFIFNDKAEVFGVAASQHLFWHVRFEEVCHPTTDLLLEKVSEHLGWMVLTFKFLL